MTHEVVSLIHVIVGVFLHDYRIKAEGVKVRTTRQSKSNSAIKDTFYWPDMSVRIL